MASQMGCNRLSREQIEARTNFPCVGSRICLNSASPTGEKYEPFPTPLQKAAAAPPTTPQHPLYNPRTGFVDDTAPSPRGNSALGANMAYNLTASAIPSLIHSHVPESLRPFVTLSYPITDPLAHPSAQTLYDKGPQDAYFVVFWAIAFTVLREVCMKGLFSPFMRICLRSPPKIKGQEREYAKARKKREHIVTRFAEQGWSWLYCSVYWTFGVVSIDSRH